MIHLFAKRDPQGYLGGFILQLLYPDKEVHITYDNTYGLTKEALEIDPEAETIIYLGYPFKETQRTIVTEQLGTILNPFTKVYHFCSFGDTFTEPNVVSIVDEENSPVLNMVNQLIATDNMVGTTRAQLAKEWADIGDDYHRYDFSIPRALDAKAFADFSKHANEFLYELIGVKTPLEVAVSYQTWFNAFNVRQKEHIRKVKETLDVRAIDTVVLAIGYDDEYRNEVAHDFIETATKTGFTHAIVLMGRKTKGSDIYTVYTTTAIHAGAIAKHLNNGNGKERVATVFLGDTQKVTHNVVESMIKEYLFS